MSNRPQPFLRCRGPASSGRSCRPLRAMVDPAALCTIPRQWAADDQSRSTPDKLEDLCLLPGSSQCDSESENRQIDVEKHSGHSRSPSPRSGPCWKCWPLTGSTRSPCRRPRVLLVRRQRLTGLAGLTAGLAGLNQLSQSPGAPVSVDSPVCSRPPPDHDRRQTSLALHLSKWTPLYRDLPHQCASDKSPFDLPTWSERGL